MKQLLKHQGFTLIELLLVIVVTGIVSVIAGRIIMAEFSGIVTSTNSINATSQARIGFDRMTRELRSIASVNSLLSTSTATQIVFIDADNNTITYSRSGSTLLRNSDVLADGIQNLSFIYYDKNGAIITPPPTTSTAYVKITITFTVQSSTFTATTTVFIRNA